MASSSRLAASARTAATSSARRRLCGGVDGEVQPEAEQLALAAGDPGGQVVGVLGGGLDLRVEQPAVVGGVPAAGFQPGQLPLQPVRGGDRVDRLDVQRHVQPTGIGQQRRQPPGMDLAGIAGDRERGHPLGCDLQVPGPDLDRVRGERPRGRPLPWGC